MIHFRSSHRIRERAGHAPGYLAFDIRLPTLIEYRKAGIGPDYTVVGRAIFYSPANLQKWLENGGTRAFEHGPIREAALAERPKKTVQRDTKTTERAAKLPRQVPPLPRSTARKITPPGAGHRRRTPNVAPLQKHRRESNGPAGAEDTEPALTTNREETSK